VAGGDSVQETADGRALHPFNFAQGQQCGAIDRPGAARRNESIRLAFFNKLIPTTMEESGLLLTAFIGES